MLDHLDDIASDMSVFHRVGDIAAMPARSFFRLAFRLAAYSGVMAARVAKMQSEGDPEAARPSPQAPAAAGPSTPSGLPPISLTQDVLRTHPAFATMPGQEPVVVFEQAPDGATGG